MKRSERLYILAALAAAGIQLERRIQRALDTQEARMRSPAVHGTRRAIVTRWERLTRLREKAAARTARRIAALNAENTAAMDRGIQRAAEHVRLIQGGR